MQPRLSEALNTYLLLDRPASTQAQYRHVLERLVAAVGPARKLSAVTYEDLLDYVQLHRESGLSPVTIRNYICIYKAFFNWCVRRAYLKRSPAADLEVAPVPRDPSSNRAVPPDELQAMVDYARYSKRDYALLLFLIATGCRIGGAASLTLANLHPDQCYAHLLEKGRRWHTARFGPVTADALRAWLAVRPSVEHPFVWTGHPVPHAPLQPASISAIIRRLAQHTGASYNWSGHFIRHATGHALARAGVPVNAVAQHLGHANWEITASTYFPNHETYLAQVASSHELAALEPPVTIPLSVHHGSRKRA